MLEMNRNKSYEMISHFPDSVQGVIVPEIFISLIAIKFKI